MAESKGNYLQFELTHKHRQREGNFYSMKLTLEDKYITTMYNELTRGVDDVGWKMLQQPCSKQQLPPPGSALAMQTLRLQLMKVPLARG